MNWEVALTPRPAASCSLRRRPLPSSSLCSSSFEARRGKVGGAEGSGRVNSLSQPQSARQTKQGEKSSTRLRSLFAESAALSERLEPAPLAGCPQNKQKTGLKRSASESCFVKTLRTHHRAAFWTFRGTDLPSASQNPRSCTRGNRRSGAFGLILHKDLFFFLDFISFVLLGRLLEHYSGEQGHGYTTSAFSFPNIWINLYNLREEQGYPHHLLLPQGNSSWESNSASR